MANRHDRTIDIARLLPSPSTVRLVHILRTYRSLVLSAPRASFCVSPPHLVAAPAGPTEQQLHEANTFNTTNEHHPLERTVCVNIRASLADLCLKSHARTS